MQDNRGQCGSSLGGGTTVCSSLSPVQLFVAPWTVAHQAPLSLEFSRQEHWSGVPFPSLGDLPHPRWNLGLLHCRQTLYQLSHQGSYYHSLVANSDGGGVLADECSPLKQAGSPHLLFSLCWFHSGSDAHLPHGGVSFPSFFDIAATPRKLAVRSKAQKRETRCLFPTSISSLPCIVQPFSLCLLCSHS